jgi:hypothetical protein
MILAVAFLVGVPTFHRAYAWDKVRICHIPPGQAPQGHIIGVSPDLVGGHIAHGDCFASDVEAGTGDPCTCD